MNHYKCDNSQNENGLVHFSRSRTSRILEGKRMLYGNLLHLLQSGRYLEASLRLRSHPQECKPRVYRQDLYHDTCLGIACRNFKRKQSNDYCEKDFLQLLSLLFHSYPSQISSSQKGLGQTPLFYCLNNPSCTVDTCRYMMEMDYSYAINNVGVQKGRRMALESLLQQLRRSRSTVLESKATLEKIQYMIELFPDLIAKEWNETSVSPLIYLLSQKIQPNQSEDQESSLKPIVDCIQLFLEQNQTLIQSESRISKCSPLHLALRNGFGHCEALIKALLIFDEDGYQLKHENTFGDLPIHVAASSNVSHEVWSLLIKNNVQQAKKKSIVDCLCSLNRQGYTPIHLLWMKRCNESLKYPILRVNTGRSSRDSGTVFLIQLEQAVKEIQVHHSSRIDELLNPYNLAKNVLGEQFWTFLCEYLESVLLMKNKYLSERKVSQFHFAHAVCALSRPYLPKHLFELATTVFSHQFSIKDPFGNLPIHYLCYNVFEQEQYRNSEARPENEIGWSESGEEAMDQLTTVLSLHPEGGKFRCGKQLYPYMIAAQSEHLDATYTLLRKDPELLLHR